ncbi:MBL fold metallo-hydrolase [Agrobacterium tumefaciens]|uniref:MBL fold metallo-hydrolase n=1 Tax=Agrobacterium tumefaciens TaxID=358 RepID=UPI0015732AA0|nr:MBL fold metallo-hydrolase [Agrobacterium tumefaciens]NTB96129.1 MBL fold metallo-hydrolase [Agrobacterium tumefaciens]NTC46654.1 MBL fold metallo-hydrolase [Agrobacterium tumefaciens]
MMLRVLMLAITGLIACSGAAFAQTASRPPVSQCQAIASNIPGVMFASFNPPGVQLAQATAKEEVKISFIGHSTYLIESPGGVTIATDYNGVYRPPVTPTVVTMNRAHSTHFTLSPDPAIQYVLHGWSDTPGEKAEHKVLVGDVYIRNVATDIRNRWGDYESFQENGNSIFIFEVAGLCIGHLGHLHHELTDTHYAEIGRLDVLMVPVDGGLTMGADSMSRVVKRLRSALILPMHRTGPPLEQFLTMFGESFRIAYAADPVIRVSMRNLPRQPQILVPKGM